MDTFVDSIFSAFLVIISTLFILDAIDKIGDRLIRIEELIDREVEEGEE